LTRELRRIDAGHRHIGAEPRHNERQGREQDPVLEFGRLAECGKIEIRG
jgi:hypothetical protein